MSYRLRFAPRAVGDLRCLFVCLAEGDLAAAERAHDAIAKAFGFLQTFPFTCRKVSAEHPFLREMAVVFGRTGCVLRHEIEGEETVRVLAVRRQREDDLY